MARLVNWPLGLSWISREPVAGPRSVGAGSSESLTGYTQTVSSVFGLWKWSFSFPPMRGEKFRRYRGLVTSLHGGANAVRVPFGDPDGLTWSDIGATVTLNNQLAGSTWSNGKSWSNGKNWGIGIGNVPLLQPVSSGDNAVRLSPTSWGALLDVGDTFGFTSHFGLYEVIKMLSPGVVQVWPPLRANILSTQYATLKPSMVMRLAGESSATAPRGTMVSEGATMTLLEVEHSDVISFFNN